jgi:FAD/FMN-containing dehydrogenase
MRPTTLFSVVASSAIATAAAAWSPSAIRDLNQTLGGRVQLLEPFARPCFSIYQGKQAGRDADKCSLIQRDYSSPLLRTQYPGAYMYEESSMCASNTSSTDKCLLNPANPQDEGAYKTTSCNQGNVPAYYISVEDARDATLAFRHAARCGGRLVIKNSGHSFMYDSSERGALMLWTRNLRSLSRDERFVPQGCPAHETFNTITTGAGVNCGEAYEFADRTNATILCAYSPTVGLSGGWVQNGGHSVMSTALGLGADRVVQFTVVTPDGVVRVANRCRNKDLFWALRGGGGGTFGLVIDSTHRVEPRIPIGVASIGIDAGNKDAVYGFMETLVDTALDLARDGWGGHIYGNKIVYVTPLMNTPDTARKSMARIIDFAERNGGTANVSIAPSFYSFFGDYVLSGAFSVGTLTLLNTRLLPAHVFSDPQLSGNFKKHLRDFVYAGGLPYVPVVGPYMYKDATSGTSMQPAWRTAVWEYGNPSSWAWNSTLDERAQVVRQMREQTAELVALAPAGGVYRNEANVFEGDWRREYYGAPYDRLLEIKNRYDPGRLLRCWKCIGWTDEDAKGTCYGAFEGQV